jgi:hypothetical protein
MTTQPFDIWVRRAATAALVAMAGVLLTLGIVLYH